MVNYGKSAYHRIIDVAFDEKVDTYSFNDTTMVEYYKTKYNLTIKNLKQPLL